MKLPLRAVLERRFLAILLLGFSSGLPLLLVGGTLKYWLGDAHVGLRAIGWFSLVALPYSLKPLWAPILDHVPLPFPRRLGRRRSWGMAIQFCLAAALLCLAGTSPDTDLRRTAALAVTVAFLSASQDVVINALTIEMLDPAEYAFGGMLSGVGYRLAMLAASAGALHIAQVADWRTSYIVMAALGGIGSVGLFLAHEPARAAPRLQSLRLWWRAAVLEPLADFATRARWPLILGFFVLYKLGPVLALSLTGPFYRELGFSKDEVAGVTKVFGLAATLAGGFAGVWVIRRFGLWRCLWWGGLAQLGALYLFALLAHSGRSIPLLMLAVLGENATAAIASTAFGTYLATLCNKRFTATQFALLTALTALSGDTLSAYMGAAAEHLGWFGFFLATPLASVPGFWLLWRLKQAIRNVQPA